MIGDRNPNASSFRCEASPCPARREPGKSVASVESVASVFPSTEWPFNDTGLQTPRGSEMALVRLIAAALLMTTSVSVASNAQESDWASASKETLEHLQAMIRMNTAN